MKKNVLRFLLALPIFGMVLAGCSNTNREEAKGINEELIEENGSFIEPMDIVVRNGEKPQDAYQEGVVLVKTYEEVDFDSIDLSISSVEELYPNSQWKKITLKSGTTYEAVKYLRNSGLFEKVDYDYYSLSDGEVIDVSGNPLATNADYREYMKIDDCWDYCSQNDFPVAGSSDVIVAVIDTGVDYNHIDLRNNVWRNTGEIPSNGIDDDNNGYVDDVVGWDFINQDNDPIDDNGHGTHVAGIIAAENNSVGTVGAAFNCKIMAIKAASTSGYFTSSSIAAAIRYAYINGASVINMSFGGTSISLAEQDELIAAYNTCNLVAAAGNDYRCEKPTCRTCNQVGAKFYPASLDYVVGVMSARDDTNVSLFSNYCHVDTYNIFANGEGILSTWPNNKYATLNGTSMAAPQVSAAAAILRSVFKDRNTYSTKFINSQITNTGTKHLYNQNLIRSTQDTLHTLIDYSKMISSSPKPHISDFRVQYYDSISISPNNNGNKIVEPGETIHVAIEATNRGGKASNIVVTAAQGGGGDSSLSDPNYTITQSTMQMDDIGTYSIGDCGYIYDENDEIIDTVNYIEVQISDTCPDSYLFDLIITIAYRNGLDSSDLGAYSVTGTKQCEVLKGIILPRTIEEDIVLKRNGLYYPDKDGTNIIPGVTLTIEDGVTIKSILSSGRISCYGDAVCLGTQDNPITSEYVSIHGTNLVCNYVNFINAQTGILDGYSNHSVVCYNCSFIKDQWKPKPEATYFEGCYFRECDTTNTFASSVFDKCGFNKCCFYDTSLNSANNIFTNNICYKSAPRPSAGANAVFKNNVIRDSGVVFPGLALQGVFEDNKFEGECYFSNYTDRYGYQIIDWTVQTGEADYSLLWPHVETLKLFDEQHNEIQNVVLREKFYVEVTFNKEMNTTKPFKLMFGSTEPYSDYLIPGEYVSSTKWEGEYTINALIEGGQQYFAFANAISAEDNKTILNDGHVFKFSIQSGGLFAMMLQAQATTDGIQLTWEQDDFDTLMGYNVYRSDNKDGNFVRLNSAIIPANENSFLDDSCVPGLTYWYTFTVVLSDFSESSPAGKTSCTAIDTIAPVIYHTPVNQGYCNNNLFISCSASDNIAIVSVTLYYRTIGDTTWKTLSMAKDNDRYSAVIFGSEVTMDGLEYYISATDGRNVITRGSAENPYQVLVKDPSLLNNLGDVDGNGTITTKDALMIIQAMNGDLILTADQFHRADLNKDGILSSFEALRILQYINGNVTTLEM